MDEVIEKLKNMISTAGSQVKVAKELGISPPYLFDIVNGNRRISDNIALKLGYEWRLVKIETKQNEATPNP